MNRIYLIAYIILMLVFGYRAESFSQARAKVTNANPKYVKDVAVFTGRKSRHDPYLTNMTGTTLLPFGNNVSLAITLKLLSGGDFRIVTKVCDTLKYKWMKEFTGSYANITLTKCPFPAARYKYMNMKLPPKNIPIPMADGDYFIKYELFVTASKESIIGIETLLRLDQGARKARSKKV